MEGRGEEERDNTTRDSRPALVSSLTGYVTSTNAS